MAEITPNPLSNAQGSKAAKPAPKKAAIKEVTRLGGLTMTKTFVDGECVDTSIYDPKAEALKPKSPEEAAARKKYINQFTTPTDSES